MKAMILAAGKGERLRPLTLTVPKPLIPVGGIPILHRILRLLRRDGFTEVVINVHYLAEKIIASVGDGSAFDLKVEYSVEKEILGTGGGIKAAEALLDDKPFLVINSDLLVDIDLKQLEKFHREQGGAATLVVRDEPALPGYGAIKIDRENKVRDILGLVNPSPEFIPRLFMGIQIIEPIFFKYLKKGAWASSTQDVYPKMIQDGHFIYSFQHTGYFRDLGTPQSYNQAEIDFNVSNIRLDF